MLYNDYGNYYVFIIKNTLRTVMIKHPIGYQSVKTTETYLEDFLLRN
ncbi:hypothetical protein FHR24_002133 [Wenyingzhuangia heitensis]|uniref:Uncharacterized protein n=1 Tax=Wenyingzhuangia heitensis TaxID=1487859 RepID=A0ABX0UCS7_9FLAO|nr:hypothetical protein [Wenyingzhuangia heitensis]NJB84133.1 hypothetical protein [Wenyingzhuangia aestuarii]